MFVHLPAYHSFLQSRTFMPHSSTAWNAGHPVSIPPNVKDALKDNVQDTHLGANVFKCVYKNKSVLDKVISFFFFFKLIKNFGNVHKHIHLKGKVQNYKIPKIDLNFIHFEVLIFNPPIKISTRSSEMKIKLNWKAYCMRS